jgi:hypothetical protein
MEKRNVMVLAHAHGLRLKAGLTAGTYQGPYGGVCMDQCSQDCRTGIWYHICELPVEGGGWSGYMDYDTPCTRLGA